ncbi:hypothetical protein AVEN_24150-1 [Araneus ventricosus]|uniref:Uncharacterized protein n=1 Tax=Araneus ventricosus TaxID=182803 RepID=A0A4Y2KIU8_ARAVE|nr:hypothetical protein AVEN_24150-1 [Araneus ventricosus]
MGVWCKQSNTQDNEELRFIHKYAGKHVAQVTGTIDLPHISSTNRQFTSNNSNSTFRFRNTNSHQITNNDSNSTFNSAQLTSFPDETLKSFQSINNTNTQYRSASNSLLAHTANRIP